MLLLSFTVILQQFNEYRAFHNILRDYKHIQQENQRTYLNGTVPRHRKIEKVFLTTRDVRCVHHGWHGTHQYNIQVHTYVHPTTATWPRWHKGTDHCSSEEYCCTHVDACVARTWISYRCVSCHPWCTHRTSLVVIKKTFSVCQWLWTIPFRWVHWFVVINVMMKNVMKRPVL
jgi:hypothetical protein